MKKNIWILTEERPKRDVIHNILYKFCRDNTLACIIDTIRILPLLNSEGDFTFTYEVTGFQCRQVERVYIKTVSGECSFVDYMVFFQEEEPTNGEPPLYVIEETKTDDSESRNTGVYQRASKFVYVDFFYPKAKKIMMYNLRIDQKTNATMTSVFGTKCLLSLGVEIMGKKEDAQMKPFRTIEELIKLKNSMRKPPAGNVPINLMTYDDRIEVSGRLYKNDSCSHDPNIGALSLICATLRKLGWQKKIVITKHGLSQKHIIGSNKFIQIAEKLKVEFDGLVSERPQIKTSYWHYEKEGEKLGTIFVHLIIENFTKGSSLFENHAGCEKGYFITKDGQPIALEKYRNREKYKAGDRSQIIQIPDLIIIDFDRSEIINVEGKKFEFRNKGIEELKSYDAIEDLLIKPNYPKYKIIRTVVLFGSDREEVIEVEVGFLLNKNGKLILGIKAPVIFREAIKNLIDFWS